MFYNQDIEVGKAVRPQLAMRVSNASSAWKKVFPRFSFLAPTVIVKVVAN